MKTLVEQDVNIILCSLHIDRERKKWGGGGGGGRGNSEVDFIITFLLFFYS